MKFRLYTKNNCPYCQAAISLLAENQKEFECYALDKQPKLFTEGQEKFIGGFRDLKEYLNKGKQLLQG